MKSIKFLLLSLLTATLVLGSNIYSAQAQTPCDLSKEIHTGSIDFTPVAVSPDGVLKLRISASISRTQLQQNCSADSIFFILKYTGNIGSVRASSVQEVKADVRGTGVNARAEFASFRQLSGGTLPTGESGSLTVRLYVVDKSTTNGPENFIGEQSTIITTVVTGGDGADNGGNPSDPGNPINNLNPPKNSSNTGSADVGKTFYNPINIDSIPEFIVRVINILLLLTGMLAVLFIIIGGLRYITSSGNPQAVTGAKNTVIYAILGLAFAVLSYAIVNVLTNVLINK